MRKAMEFVIALSFLAAAALSAQRPQKLMQKSPIDRGRYLVEEVGMCGECHSPRDSQGNLDHSRWLQGAPTWFTPIRPIQNWAYAAPALAGLPSFSDADMANILERGLTPAGAPIRPPMHVYHLTHEDALSIVVYLRSLKPSVQ